MKTPLLLTPGPLSTTETVRAACMRDWGSRDEDFIELTRRVRERLLHVLPHSDGLSAVPIQGSGTFAVEAMLGTFVPRDGRLLVVVNGSYGRRMVEMCRLAGRDVSVLEGPETETPDLLQLDRRLAEDRTISHVAVVHCETTTGILNPLAEISDLVASHARELLIDAMSSFGGIAIDESVRFQALASSANKCLQALPGAAFVIAPADALKQARGRPQSLVLDLAAQWDGFEANGQWRFTPPTHVVAALDRALDEFEGEGGVRGRAERYRRNLHTLVDGLAGLGMTPLLPSSVQAPIIVTYPAPQGAWYAFPTLYRELLQRGFAIYPGKTARVDSFRIGCIGAVEPADMENFVGQFRDAVASMKRQSSGV